MPGALPDAVAFQCHAAKRSAVFIEHRQRPSARPEKLRQRIALRGCDGQGFAAGIARLQHGFQIGEREKAERPLSGSDQPFHEFGRGRARISAGGPNCKSLPSSITAMRSPSEIASSISCVTRRMVVPKRRWIALRSSCALARITGQARRKVRPSGGCSVRRQGPRHADALLLPAGKFVRIAVAIGARLKLEQLQQFTRASMRLFRPAERVERSRYFRPTVRCGKSPCCWIT